MEPHVWQLAGLFLLSFFSEDAAVLGGGFLALMNMGAASAAFLACLLGIWIGDLGLYYLAMRFGRPCVDRLCGNRRLTREKLERSERWFRRHGFLALALCRVVPGTRLPTYLTAGLLRMPPARFACISGALAALWVMAVFVAVFQFGKAAPGLFHAFHLPTALVAVIIAVTVAVLSFRANLLRHLGGAPWVQRWSQWEFWPAWLFYLPVAFHYVRLAAKHRGLTLPTCANPGMFTGGLIGESKFATLNDLARFSSAWLAPSYLLQKARTSELKRILGEGLLEFPFVLKPDVGQRGSGFKVIRNLSAAQNYLDMTDVPAVAQEYVPGPHEAGVFYYRFPDEPRGRILSITEKVFPVIVGDGHRTIAELIRADGRARLLAGTYLRRFQEKAELVLPLGESLRLVEAGNHAQGCIFRDGMHLWSEQLEARFDDISRKLSGFYIGRYDVRFASPEEFRQGRGFKILELNGAASEATSAYDASSKSLRDAYRLLFKQWELVFAIGRDNRRRGCREDSLRTIASEWWRYQSRSLCHPLAD